MNKFNNFIEDLKELCATYDVVITTSEYDPIQVWDRNGDPLDYAEIEDMTKQEDIPIDDEKF